MTCGNISNFTNSESTRRNTILDTLKKIDQSQKEAVIESDCIGCGGTLITKQFDTKPLVLTVADDSKFSAYIGTSTTTTDLFRVEDVNSDSCLLRALERNAGMIRCTRFTCILRIDAIIGLQCLDPINCQIERSERYNFND